MQNSLASNKQNQEITPADAVSEKNKSLH